MRSRRGGGEGYLFIVTYGRSGSTLVQGLLNAIPGYLIRGENGGAVRGLFDFHRQCALEAGRRNPRRNQVPSGPFFGITDFDAQASLDGIRRTVVTSLLRPEPGTRVAGFKEIRWDYPDLPDYLAFLRQAFPGARFVVNTRDLADVAKSGWWAERDDALTELARIEKRLLDAAAELGHAACRVHYDDYRADPAVLAGLFEWLGEPFDLERVLATLAVPHSVKGGRPAR